MKLSDAILLGSTLGPQTHRRYESPEGSRCALGAALAAAGKKCDEEAMRAHDELWPHLAYPCYGGGYACPVGCGAIALDLASSIVHLNDEHFLTFEQIAAYAAPFDPPEVVEAPPLQFPAPQATAPR